MSAVGLSHLLLTFAADGDGWELHCCCKAKDHQATSHQGVRDMGSNEQNFKKVLPLYNLAEHLCFQLAADEDYEFQELLEDVKVKQQHSFQE